MNHIFPVLHLQKTKEFCFLLLQKGEKFVLMLLLALFFGIFYFLIRNAGADNAIYCGKSSANTNTPATNILPANTSSADLCSIATDNISLTSEQQNAISAVSVVQTSTSKAAKEFQFVVRIPNLDMLLSALRTIQPTSRDSERAGNLQTKIRNKMEFRLFALI
jgi:hypothetical protein